MSNITYTGNKVMNNGVLIYSFYGEIDKIIEHGALIFVLLKLKGNEVDNQNLFCINQNGELIWRNEDMLAGRDPDSSVPPYAHYTNIKLLDGQLWGNNYYGTFLNLLDMHTGKIIESHYMK